MTGVATAMAVTAGVGMIEGDKNRKAMQSANDSQLALATEQYNDYKTNIMPLEIEAKGLGVDAQELAVQRGKTDLDLYNNYYVPLQKQMVDEATNIEPQYDRVTRDAANDVDQNFAMRKEAEDRNAFQMGLRPDSGRYKGLERGRELEQAATRSFAVNRASESERNRVEGLKFNRMATVMGRQPGAASPIQSAPGLSLNPNNLNNAYANQAASYGRQASSDIQSAGDAMYAGANLYARFKTPKQPAPQTTYTPFSGSTAQGQQNFDSMPFDQISAGSTAFQHGGLVEGQEGIDQVPASIDNNEPARLTSGEFVIPKDVVDKKGTEFFEKMIMQFHEGAPEKPRAGLNDLRRVN